MPKLIGDIFPVLNRQPLVDVEPNAYVFIADSPPTFDKQLCILYKCTAENGQTGHGCLALPVGSRGPGSSIVAEYIAELLRASQVTLDAASTDGG